VSASLDKFTAELKQKLGGVTLDEWVTAHPGYHLWAPYGEYECCAACGTVRSRGTLKPCRGIVKVGLRGISEVVTEAARKT
jgi:hypothetical protein